MTSGLEMAGLFLFRCFLNLSLTYLDNYPLTYSLWIDMGYSITGRLITSKAKSMLVAVSEVESQWYMTQHTAVLISYLFFSKNYHCTDAVNWRTVMHLNKK